MIRNVPQSQGYCDSKGLYSARKAVMQYCQQIHINNVDVDDIYIGNGVSELVAMSMQALINDGDEVLIPVRISHCGRRLSTSAASQYIICAMRKTIGNPIWPTFAARSHLLKAMVVINPNNQPALFINAKCSNS